MIMGGLSQNAFFRSLRFETNMNYLIISKTRLFFAMTKGPLNRRRLPTIAVAGFIFYINPMD